MRQIFRCNKDRENSLLNSSCRYQLLATFIVNIITFSHGVGVGWLSPTLAKIKSPETPLDFEVTIGEISWLGSMLGLGSLCGNIVNGIFLDRLGRKFCIYLIAFPSVCIWIMVYCAKNVGYLYAARFLCGFTGGAGYGLVPIYLSEIADSNVRGSLSSMLMLSVNTGVLLGYILSTYLGYFVVPFLVILLPIGYFIAALFLPETTQFLLRKNKIAEAESSFIFYKNLKNEDAQSYQAEFDELKATIAKSQVLNVQQFTYRDLLTKPALKAFLSALVLSMGYQFSNVFSFINYMSEIFAKSGSVLDPNTCTIIIGLVQIVGVYTSTMFVDIWGRRILMLMSTSGIFIGCFAFGFFTYFAEFYDLSGFNWLPLVLMIFIVYVANIGLIGIFFIVLVEAFPVKIRSIGTTIGIMTLSILVFFTLKLFPLMLHHFGISISMWCSGTASFLTFVYFLFFLQETKGKSMIVD